MGARASEGSVSGVGARAPASGVTAPCAPRRVPSLLDVVALASICAGGTPRSMFHSLLRRAEIDMVDAPLAILWRLPSLSMINRRELVDHLDLVIRPPLPRWLVDQVERALELAVAGREDDVVEINCRRYRVHRAVELYELEELVACIRDRQA
jgi:hypothetical protein